MQWWETERLRQFGRPVQKQRSGRPQPGPPVWFGCGAAACWTRCYAGSHPVRPVQGFSDGAGIVSTLLRRGVMWEHELTHNSFSTQTILGPFGVLAQPIRGPFEGLAQTQVQ